jgi:hypothetical protein
MGAAISYAITILLINVLRIIELYYFEKIQPFKLSIVKPLFAGTLIYLIVFFAMQQFKTGLYLELIMGSIVYISLFLAMVWMLRLDNEDKYLIEIFIGRIKKQKK